MGCMKASRRILDCDELHAGVLTVDFDATEARQQVSLPAMDDRAAIELGDNLNRHLELPPRTFHDVSLGNRADEIAAKRNERLNTSVAHGLTGPHGVETTLAGWVEAVLLSEAIEGDQIRLFGYPDGALTLNIRMAAHRKNASPRLANVAAHEQQIAKHLDRENTGTVLREAHAVAGDNGLGVAIDICCRFYGSTTQARACFDRRPLEVVHARHEGIEAACFLLDEID